MTEVFSPDTAALIQRGVLQQPGFYGSQEMSDSNQSFNSAVGIASNVSGFANVLKNQTPAPSGYKRTKDNYILTTLERQAITNKANQLGKPLRMIELADKINESMPQHFVKKAIKITGHIASKRILVIGISYKPNTADIRESSALKLIVELKNQGAYVYWHDDVVKVWNGEKSTPLSKNFDLAILAVHHDHLDLSKLIDVPILDTRRSL